MRTLGWPRTPLGPKPVGVVTDSGEQGSSEELDGEEMPAIGELDEATWGGGSRAASRWRCRSGRAAAVLVDADSYAEMVRTTQVLDGPA